MIAVRWNWIKLKLIAKKPECANSLKGTRWRFKSLHQWKKKPSIHLEVTMYTHMAATDSKSTQYCMWVLIGITQWQWWVGNVTCMSRAEEGILWRTEKYELIPLPWHMRLPCNSCRKPDRQVCIYGDVLCMKSVKETVQLLSHVPITGLRHVCKKDEDE